MEQGHELKGREESGVYRERAGALVDSSQTLCLPCLTQENLTLQWG